MACEYWGSKYPDADPEIEFAYYVYISGSPIALRLTASSDVVNQFTGVSIKPTWGAVPWYIWKFQTDAPTIFPPNSRWGFTDAADYDGNTYDFYNGETGNRVFLQILSDNTGTNAYVKLHAVRDGVYDSDSAVIVNYSNYATYPIADFKTKSFKVELSGATARVLYNGTAIVTPQTDGDGWVTYTGGSPFPEVALSSQTYWSQLDDNYDAVTSELTFSDVQFDSGSQSYVEINHCASPTNSTCLAFDIRILSEAVTTTSGTSDGTDLGAINYYYKDMDENEGKVVLPYG